VFFFFKLSPLVKLGNKLDLNYFGEKNREKKPMKKELRWNYRGNKTRYFLTFFSRALPLNIRKTAKDTLKHLQFDVYRLFKPMLSKGGI